eukprot:Gb_12336 [translate_table: standard]
MEDHVVLYVDRLVTEEGTTSDRNGSASPQVECRICQEEDDDTNMEAPCACSGSLKYAHRKCVQRWCNEKGDTTCEICHQSSVPFPPFQYIQNSVPFLLSVSLFQMPLFCLFKFQDLPFGLTAARLVRPGFPLLLQMGFLPYRPGYTAPQPAHSEGIPIDIRGSWGMPGAQLDVHDHRLLAMAAAERHFLESEYGEYAAANASGAACCRSAALILLALLLLRHALTINGAGTDEDTSTFFTVGSQTGLLNWLFLLRAAGFLLPCYIMARAMNILQRRRQRQEAAMAAAEVALLLQAGHARGLRITTSGS